MTPQDFTATTHLREEIHAAKQTRRRELARLPFAEKIAIVESLRRRLAPLREARERRQKGL